MSKEEETITFSEPIISYSPSYIYSSETSKGKDKHSSNLIFTPLWISNMKPSYSEQHLQKPSNQKLRKSTFFHQSTDSTSFYRVNTISELQRSNFNKTRNKTENVSKKSDLSKIYDELIEKLKTSPPHIKSSFTKETYINKYKLEENEKKQLKKKMTIPEEVTNEIEKNKNKEDFQNIKDKNNNNNENNNNKNIKDNNNNNNKNTKIPKNIINYEEKEKKQNIQSNKFKFNPEEKVKNFTNTENISDFYEYTERCMEMILDLDKSKQVQIKEKVNLNFPENSKKKIALFDLDETLAHCVGEIKEGKKPTKPYKHIVDVILPSRKQTKIGINIRPNLEETLELINEKFNIVIYTASHQSYADAVLNYMDPEKKYTKYRLYRNHCVQANVDGQKFYIKDLSIFDKYYDLKDIVIVDNSVLSFAYHLNNGIPIVPYYDSEEDGELTILGYYLISICDYNDLREANKEHIRIEFYLDKAKKQREEEEEEDDDVEDEEMKLYPIKTVRNSINYVNNTHKVIDDDNNNIKTEVQRKDENIILENKVSKKNIRGLNKGYDRSQTIMNKKNSSLSPEKRIPKRKKTNIGLNIVNIWEGIKKEMSTVNN